MAKEMRQRSGRTTVPKSPIGSTNDWWGMKGNPHQSKFHFIIVIENKRNQQPRDPVSEKENINRSRNHRTNFCLIEIFPCATDDLNMHDG